MTDEDMADMEIIDQEFMDNVSDEDIVTDVESSDDEFCTDNLPPDDDNNDDEVNYENDYSSDDSDSESDILPPRRQVMTLSSDDKDIVGDSIRNKIEKNIFSEWYDVTENDCPSQIISFTSGMPSTGPQVPESIKEPMDFFKLFFTDELIHNIVLQTNKYASSKIVSSEMRPSSTWRTWKPVTFNEMSAFMGVILNMGLIPSKNMQYYWSKEPNLYIPFFSNTFRRERFFQIFWMLHLSENPENQTPKTGIQKVDNFLKYIESKFQTYYVPNKNISIDESVVKFKGKVTHNKNKPTKWGIRIYVLADSSNGYIYSILPYYGSITTESLIRPELSVTTRIVLHLYSTLLNKLPKAEGYSVFCDRYYSSLSLASELLKLKCHFMGTINRNRNCLPKFDLADQLATSYCFLHKSFKWWRKLFFWGIEVCSINAFTLYKSTMLKQNEIPMTHFKFVSTLVKQLVGDFKEGSLARGRPSPMDTEERLNGKAHFNIKWQNGKKKDCIVCSKRNVKNGRHETRYFCETCTRKPGLHPGICFNRYHTMKNYKI